MTVGDAHILNLMKCDLTTEEEGKKKHTNENEIIH